MAYKVKFDTGETISFENQPTDADIEDVVRKLGIKPKNAVIPENQQQPQKDLLGKTEGILSSVVGGKKIGEAIGTGIAKLTVPKEQRQYIAPAPPIQEIAGDVAGIGLTIAGLKGVGSIGSFGARLLKMAGLGAGLGASEIVEEGGGIKEATKGAVSGGIVGAAIPVVGKGLSTLGKQISLLPARFVNSALSRSKAEVLKDIASDKVDNFAKYVVEKKPIGTANKLLNDSFASIENLGNRISSSLESATRQTGIKKTIGLTNFFDQITKLPEAEGALLKRADIKSIVEKLAPQTKKLLSQQSLTLTEANKLRQLVDKTLGDRAFLGGQLTSDKAILKTFANNLRELVKQKAPEGTRALFAELSNEIRFRDGLLDRIAKRAGNQVLSFGDFIGGGLGGIFGGGLGGAVLGVGARRAIESVPFKLGSAKFINALTKSAPILDSFTPAQQTTILNLFAELFSPEENAELPQ